MRLPAALAPFADPARVSTPWPLLLSAGEPRSFMAFVRVLTTELRATLLQDNIGRLEAEVRGGEEQSPRDRIRAAGLRMRTHLALREGPDGQLRDELDSLAALIPEGRLLDFGPRGALSLLQAAARQRALPLREALEEELSRVRRELVRVLEVERRHEQSTGPLKPRRGTVAMDPVRRERIAALVETLHIKGPVFIVVQPGERGCEHVAERFDEAARELARSLGALRAARLELANGWDPAKHSTLLAEFGWQDFGPSEAQLLATVVLVQAADALVSDELAALTRLLASGRPIHILAETVPTRNPGLGADEDPLAGHRVDLGMVAIGLGHAYVQQSTTARQEHLWAGFEGALSGARPALHLVFSGLFDGLPSPVGGWLTASAAVESRALPLFRYDPARGDSWAHSMDVSGNPQPDQDWSGDPAFRFADYALLDPALAHHFAANAEGDIPSTEGPLADSDALKLAGADRLRTWRRLRELGGVANEHARAAAAEARERALADAAVDRAELAAAHDAELQQLRAEAAKKAIQRLASALVEGNLATPITRPPERTVSAPEPVVVQEPVAAAEPEPEPEEPESEEAWVDSDLCTSCNDCVEINPLLFVYDGNKQITLGDLSQGTYDELVRAAELCPSSCIHPGSQ